MLKGDVVSKDFYEGIDSVTLSLVLLAKSFSSMDLENWFVVSDKSGNFYNPGVWQSFRGWVPCTSTLVHTLNIMSALKQIKSQFQQNKLKRRKGYGKRGRLSTIMNLTLHLQKVINLNSSCFVS